MSLRGFIADGFAVEGFVAAESYREGAFFFVRCSGVDTALWARRDETRCCVCTSDDKWRRPTISELSFWLALSPPPSRLFTQQFLDRPPSERSTNGLILTAQSTEIGSTNSSC